MDPELERARWPTPTGAGRRRRRARSGQPARNLQFRAAKQPATNASEWLAKSRPAPSSDGRNARAAGDCHRNGQRLTPSSPRSGATWIEPSVSCARHLDGRAGDGDARRRGACAAWRPPVGTHPHPRLRQRAAAAIRPPRRWPSTTAAWRRSRTPSNTPGQAPPSRSDMAETIRRNSLFNCRTTASLSELQQAFNVVPGCATCRARDGHGRRRMRLWRHACVGWSSRTAADSLLWRPLQSGRLSRARRHRRGRTAAVVGHGSRPSLGARVSMLLLVQLFWRRQKLCGGRVLHSSTVVLPDLARRLSRLLDIGAQLSSAAVVAPVGRPVALVLLLVTLGRLGAAALRQVSPSQSLWPSVLAQVGF